jgi:hypothetical protein
MITSHRCQRRSVWFVALSALGGTALLAACSSAGPGSTAAGAASPSASASVSGLASAPATISCPSITALRASLTNLEHLQVNQQTAGQVGADIGNLDKQLAAVKGQAQGAYSRQSAQLTAAVLSVTRDARALVAHPSVTNLEAVESAVSALRASSQSLIADLRAACPGS